MYFLFLSQAYNKQLAIKTSQIPGCVAKDMMLSIYFRCQKKNSAFWDSEMKFIAIKATILPSTILKLIRIRNKAQFLITIKVDFCFMIIYDLLIKLLFIGT